MKEAAWHRERFAANAAAKALSRGNVRLFDDPAHETDVWEIRRSGCEYTRIPGEHSGLVGWEDAAVPPERLGGYLRERYALLERHGYTSVLSGHFGQGLRPLAAEPGPADGARHRHVPPVHRRGRRPGAEVGLGATGRQGPGLANGVLHTPLAGTAGKLLAGVAARRSAPLFAKPTFREWFSGHQPKYGGDREVILWPDTFTDHFSPEIGIAAVGVLERAGCAVRLPERRLCCGRPLYDYGMLPTAKRWLRQIVDELREPAAAGCR